MECEHDNDIIGVSNLRFEEQLHHSECIAEIMEFAVDKTYRKQGIENAIGKQTSGFLIRIMRIRRLPLTMTERSY